MTAVEDKSAASAGDSRQIRALIQEGRFGDAVAACEALLQRARDGDERIDLLYMRAVAQRYNGNLQNARHALQDLEKEAEQFPRLHQERGHLERLMGNSEAATAAYRKATTLDPALHASWRALGELYQAEGQTQPADQAFAKARQLADLPPELVSATNFLNENRLHKAEQLCRAFLQKNKTHVEGMRLLADIATRLKVYDDAEFLLETCLELEPDHLAAREQYLNLLLRKQQFETAHQQAQRLLAANPANTSFRSLLAATLVGLGRFEEGIALYRELIAQMPEQARLHLMLGHALKAPGHLKDAIASYRQAYAVKPDFGDAFWSLANIKTYRFTEAEMEHIRHYEADPAIGVDDRIHFCFAAGKGFEDLGDFTRSFEYYERGNTLKQRQLKYRDEVIQHQVKSQIVVCNPELFKRHNNAGCPAQDPIFIVGLPRAGSTLLEQILASHSMVDGTMELHNILALVQRLRGRSQVMESRYPAILHELGSDYFRRFGEQYLADTRVYRAGAPLFIDKMPNNFVHVGLIRLILPNAKIIDARRHPMACCFSGFKQLFGEGQEFTYGLHEIGRYYNAYMRLMDHWDEVLPGFVLRVMHEDVVADLEGQVRRILDFCGLPFEDQCLQFYDTERSVRTPSSEQVKQPIYRNAVAQWRHFEPWLEPLKEALGPEILARYTAPA